MLRVEKSQDKTVVKNAVFPCIWHALGTVILLCPLLVLSLINNSIAFFFVIAVQIIFVIMIELMPEKMIVDLKNESFVVGVVKIPFHKVETLHLKEIEFITGKKIWQLYAVLKDKGDPLIKAPSVRLTKDGVKTLFHEYDKVALIKIYDGKQAHTVSNELAELAHKPLEIKIEKW